MFSLGILLWELCIGHHPTRSRFSRHDVDMNDKRQRNNLLRYSDMFQHCVLPEHKTLNQERKIPFWKCTRCSYVEQLRETLSQKPGVFEFIMRCLDPCPDTRITPLRANQELSGQCELFTESKPDRDYSLPEATEIQLSLKDANHEAMSPGSLNEKSSRKFACLSICDVSKPLSHRCQWLNALFKFMTGQQQNASPSCDSTDKYRRARDLLMDFGFAHAIALFAEDTELKADDSHYLMCQTALVNVIGFLVSAGEQDFYCTLSIMLPPVFRFICGAAKTHSDISSRALDIACMAFSLISIVGNRTQHIADRIEMQETLDVMQRNAKPGRLLGWVFGHREPIDLLTILCLHASEECNNAVRLSNLMQCVSTLLTEMKSRINDATRPLSEFIALQRACDSSENSRILFEIYHRLQCMSPFDELLSDLVLANCADILECKAGPCIIQEAIIGPRIGPVQETAAGRSAQVIDDANASFFRLVSLVEVAQKSFNMRKVIPPLPTGFIHLCKCLSDDYFKTKGQQASFATPGDFAVQHRAKVLDAHGTDAHLLCVLVSVLKAMKTVKAPFSSIALLDHLSQKQWNSNQQLEYRDVILFESFWKEVYTSIVKTSEKSARPAKSRSPHVAFRNFCDELGSLEQKPSFEAVEAMLSILRLPKSSQIGKTAVALVFDKLAAAISAMPSHSQVSPVAALCRLGVLSLFALPRMFLDTNRFLDPAMCLMFKNHADWDILGILGKIETDKDFYWVERYASVLQLQTLLLTIYDGCDDAVLQHRNLVFCVINDVIIRLLKPRNPDAVKKFNELPAPFRQEFSLFRQTLGDVFSDDKSKHQEECQVCVKMKCAELKKKGLSAEQALSLFTSPFDFPVNTCRTLCTCWCLMISRHPSLLMEHGISCLEFMHSILDAASLSCVQAKTCAADMVIAVSKYCDTQVAAGSDHLRSHLIPLLQDVAESIYSTSSPAEMTAVAADQHTLAAAKCLKDFTQTLAPPIQLLFPQADGW
jgi:hypothetical protein